MSLANALLTNSTRLGRAGTEAASEFFRTNPAGYSPNHRATRLEGVELRTRAWSIEPAVIHHVRSSMFDDRKRFPAGSIHLDSVLVMRNVPADWHGIGSIAHAAMSSTASI